MYSFSVFPGGGRTPEGNSVSVPNSGEEIQQGQETDQRVPAEVRREEGGERRKETFEE